MKKILSIWICLILSLSITSFSYADESIQTYEDYAKKLEKIGIFYGATMVISWTVNQQGLR